VVAIIRQDEIRTPPHSVEAEQAVLGGLMLDATAWDAVADVLTSADFYRRDHRLIFEAITEVAEIRGACDAVTISEHLERKGRLDEIGGLSLAAKNPVRLTSVCTVFVESDIMSYLAQRKTIEDILGGVHKAIATRTMSLVRRVGVEPEVTFTGGVSRNVGMVRALEAVLGAPLNVSGEGHFMGALGAALFALERAQLAAGALAGRA